MLSSRKQLRELSNEKVFERGQDLYKNGSVRSVVRRGDVLEGRVVGSRPYAQMIWLHTLRSDCSCPYDFDGWCKHRVAVGLAFLAGDFSQEIARPQPDPPSLEAWARALNDADDQQLRRAMTQLLWRNESLQRDFPNFVQPAPKLLAQTDVRAARNLLREKLGAIAFDYDELDYGDDYDDVDEAAARTFRKKAEDALRTSSYHLLDFLQRGEWIEATRVLLAVYESQSVDLGEWAEYNVRDELDGAMDALCFAPYKVRLRTGLLHPKTATACIDEIFKRRRRHAERPEKEVYFAISDFAEVLQVLAADFASARYLLTQLEAYSLFGKEWEATHRHVRAVLDNS